jgi:hypothetical protein
MLRTLWAVIREGKIEPSEVGELPEGARVLVTILPDEEVDFWRGASQGAMDGVWDNSEDDVYAELLKK